MLEQLTQLATEKSSVKRAELMTAIADMFVKRAAKKSSSELELFSDIFVKLLDQMDHNHKKEISEKFALLPDTPISFAFALIYDDAEVAAPMLEFSTVLVENELIEVTHNTTTGHRVAIAKRYNVSENITDALISYGESSVLQAVTSNLSANISTNGFVYIKRYSDQDEQLKKQFYDRPDLPKDLKLIMPYLPNEVQEQVGFAAQQHGKQEMQNLMDSSHELMENTQISAAKQSKPSCNNVREIRDGSLDLNKVLIKLSRSNKPYEVAKIIAEVEHIDHKIVNEAIMNITGETLVTLSRSIEISDQAFEQICKMRCRRLNLPVSNRKKLLNQFKSLDVDQAKRDMRYAKLEGAIQKSLN